MSQTRRLPPHAQKAVVGRLLGFEILAPRLSGLQLLGFEDAGDRLCERLCWLTNEALDDPDAQDSLDSFLADLVRKLQAEVPEFHAAAARDAVAPILDELAERVETFRASPYDPIERLLHASTQTAADFYSFFGEAVPPELESRPTKDLIS